MMLGAQTCACSKITGLSLIWEITDHQTFFRSSISSTRSLSYSHHRHNYLRNNHRLRRSKPVLVSCKSSRGGESNDRRFHDDSDGDYIEAVVLISETLRHYRMRTYGYQEEMKWQSSAKLFPFSLQGKAPRLDNSTVGPGFLRRYRSPTIFLKVSCDGDFLLPIIVGEFAVEKLLSFPQEDAFEDCPNQFQLMRNIVRKFGYEVKMVRITERIDNIYFAGIYFHKPGEIDIRVDARPSDAINVAQRCGAPIFVNKHIVLTDAIKIAHGTGRLSDPKSTYDVSLDSATDGPDLLAEELDVVTKMKLAIKEERYDDAAMWRDKLLKLREWRHDL